MFSEIVDDVVTQSGRRDRLADIVKYVNATIRECQCLSFFYKDLIEDQMTATANPHIWNLPVQFRKMRAVKYEDGRFPNFRQPGKRNEDIIDKVNGFYYAASTYMVFAHTHVGLKIDYAYYRYLPRLIYYPQGTRPAFYDIETQTWEYLNAATPEEQEEARNKVSNWLMYDWSHLLTEGALAKLYKVLSDQRAPASYSLYKQQQVDLMTGEISESLNY